MISSNPSPKHLKTAHLFWKTPIFSFLANSKRTLSLHAFMEMLKNEVCAYENVLFHSLRFPEYNKQILVTNNSKRVNKTYFLKVISIKRIGEDLPSFPCKQDLAGTSPPWHRKVCHKCPTDNEVGKGQN